MAKRDWLLQLRQLLFEQRVVAIWLGHERLSLGLALRWWRALACFSAAPAPRLGAAAERESGARCGDERARAGEGAWRSDGPGTSGDGAVSWRQLQDQLLSAEAVIAHLHHERSVSVESSRNDALRLQHLEGQLRIVEQDADRLRAENYALRERLVSTLSAHTPPSKKLESDPRLAEACGEQSALLVRQLQDQLRSSKALVNSWREERLLGARSADNLSQLHDKSSSSDSDYHGASVARLPADPKQWLDHLQKEGDLALEQHERAARRVHQLLDDKLSSSDSDASPSNDVVAQLGPLSPANAKQMGTPQLEQSLQLEQLQAQLNHACALVGSLREEQFVSPQHSPQDLDAQLLQEKLWRSEAVVERLQEEQAIAVQHSEKKAFLERALQEKLVDYQNLIDTLQNERAAALKLAEDAQAEVQQLEEELRSSKAVATELYEEKAMALLRAEESIVAMQRLQSGSEIEAIRLKDELDAFKSQVEAAEEEKASTLQRCNENLLLVRQLEAELRESEDHANRLQEKLRSAQALTELLEHERGDALRSSKEVAIVVQEVRAEVLDREAYAKQLQDELNLSSLLADQLRAEGAQALQREKESSVLVLQLQGEIRRVETSASRLRDELQVSATMIGQLREERAESLKRGDESAVVIQQLQPDFQEHASRLQDDLTSSPWEIEHLKEASLHGPEATEGKASAGVHLATNAASSEMPKEQAARKHGELIGSEALLEEVEEGRAVAVLRCEEELVAVRHLQAELRDSETEAMWLREELSSLKTLVGQLEVERDKHLRNNNELADQAEQLRAALANSVEQIQDLHKEQAVAAQQILEAASRVQQLQDELNWDSETSSLCTESTAQLVSIGEQLIRDRTPLLVVEAEQCLNTRKGHPETDAPRPRGQPTQSKVIGVSLGAEDLADAQQQEEGPARADHVQGELSNIRELVGRLQEEEMLSKRWDEEATAHVPQVMEALSPSTSFAHHFQREHAEAVQKINDSAERVRQLQEQMRSGGNLSMRWSKVETVHAPQHVEGLSPCIAFVHLRDKEHAEAAPQINDPADRVRQLHEELRSGMSLHSFESGGGALQEASPSRSSQLVRVQNGWPESHAEQTRTEEARSHFLKIEDQLSSSTALISGLREEQAMAVRRIEEASIRAQELQDKLCSSEALVEVLREGKMVAVQRSEEASRRVLELEEKLSRSEAMVDSLRKVQTAAIHRGEEAAIRMQWLQDQLSSSEATIRELRGERRATSQRSLEDASQIQLLRDRLTSSEAILTRLREDQAASERRSQEAARHMRDIEGKLASSEALVERLRDERRRALLNSQQSTARVQQIHEQLCGSVDLRSADAALAPSRADDTDGEPIKQGKLEARHISSPEEPRELIVLQLRDQLSGYEALVASLREEREAAVRQSELSTMRVFELQEKLSSIETMLDVMREEKVATAHEGEEAALLMQDLQEKLSSSETMVREVREEHALALRQNEMLAWQVRNLQAKLASTEASIESLHEEGRLAVQRQEEMVLQMQQLESKLSSAEALVDLMRDEQTVAVEHSQQAAVREQQLQERLSSFEVLVGSLRDAETFASQRIEEDALRLQKLGVELRSAEVLASSRHEEQVAAMKRYEEAAARVQQLETKLASSEAMTSRLRDECSAAVQNSEGTAAHIQQLQEIIRDLESQVERAHAENTIAVRRGEQDAINLEQLHGQLRGFETLALTLRQERAAALRHCDEREFCVQQLQSELSSSEGQMDILRRERGVLVLRIEEASVREQMLQEKLTMSEREVRRLHSESSSVKESLLQTSTKQLESQRMQWLEQLEHERQIAQQRRDREIATRSQLEDKLSTAESLLANLRIERMLLRQELSNVELGHALTLQRHQKEAGERSAAWTLRARREAALRAQLDGEILRLDEASAQLRALEVVVEQADASMRSSQRVESHQTQQLWLSAVTGFHSVRSARNGWGLLRAHARALFVKTHHEAQQRQLDSDRQELDKVRDYRAALQWRVTENRAKLLVLGGADDDGHAEYDALHGQSYASPSKAKVHIKSSFLEPGDRCVNKHHLEMEHT